MDALRGAEFFTPDGDDADFKVVTGRVCDLVDALRRADLCGTVSLSPETVVAAAFIVYKSDAIPRRCYIYFIFSTQKIGLILNISVDQLNAKTTTGKGC